MVSENDAVFVDVPGVNSGSLYKADVCTSEYFSDALVVTRAALVKTWK